jgi:hypothetical protein
VLLGLAAFLFFPMAISVNDQHDKNNEAGDSENDDDGFVMPYIAYKIGNVRTHIFPTYTIFIEFETHDQAPVIFAVAAPFLPTSPRAGAPCGIGNEPRVRGA